LTAKIIRGDGHDGVPTVVLTDLAYYQP
jgi:hypothetical protein